MLNASISSKESFLDKRLWEWKKAALDLNVFLFLHSINTSVLKSLVQKQISRSSQGDLFVYNPNFS